MKKSLYLITTVIALTSCGSSYEVAQQNGNERFSETTSYNSAFHPITTIESANDYDLEIAKESVTYTIDISTPEGQLKLKGATKRQAADKALTEAIIANRCAAIINPQYDFLIDGDDILRVTLFGFPAFYKNRPKEDPVIETVTTTKTTTTTTKAKKKKK
ncbi:MAG: hypothetical protein IK092_00260 [Muribaculaceae bacterium]|nr:hypothetical protein [Muribaculaceae bacterium]